MNGVRGKDQFNPALHAVRRPRQRWTIDEPFSDGQMDCRPLSWFADVAVAHWIVATAGRILRCVDTDPDRSGIKDN